MEIHIETTDSGENNFKILDNEVGMYSDEEIAEMIIDSFYEHIHLSNQLKQKEKRWIDLSEYSYNNEDIRLQKESNWVYKSSDTLMGLCMKEIHDSYLPNHHELVNEYSITNYPESILETFANIQNTQWMQDLAEQLKVLKSDSITYSVGEEKREEFHYYYYAEILEADSVC